MWSTEGWTQNADQWTKTELYLKLKLDRVTQTTTKTEETEQIKS